MNEGDEGNVFEGDELNELVSYDWMNDGLERADLTDDIFGGNKDEDNNEVVGNEGDIASDAQSSMQAEVVGNGGIMQVMLSHQCSLGLMRRIMHSLGLGIIDSLKLGIMHSLKLRIMHNQQWE